MAKKSKTQKAKASAARAQKKIEQELKAQTEDQQEAVEETVDAKKEKRSLFKKTDSSSTAAVEKKPAKREEKPAKKDDKPAAPKKKRFQFLRDVRAELRRVTWPTKQDVLRWSMVVVGALVFFGLFTYGFDQLFQVVLLAYSGLAVS